MIEKKSKIKFKNMIMILLLISSGVQSCKKDAADPEQDNVKPTISNVEVGLDNKGIGIAGRDFHLNADIVAGGKIDVVEIKVLPIATESYASPWSFTQTWTEFKGAKNTNVHKHFDIPADAIDGKYDFIIVVKDENGTELEEKRNITIIRPENLPVDPQLSSFMIVTSEGEERIVVDLQAQESNRGDGILKMNESLNALVTIDAVKGDGKMYIVLINKKLNHRPESIAAIDETKAIIWSIKEHKNLTVSQNFSSFSFDQTVSPPVFRYSKFTIGANLDSASPTPNPITGLKSWESGDYYIGVLYTNTTYNISLVRYAEATLKI